VAWRAGLNWKAVPNTLLYVNVSQGFKAGSFPTIAASTYSELVPVHQESLLSYEAGLKSTLFDRQVTIDGAGFYYDYHDKQILGDINDPIFGPLAALVNIPQSHVVGFELAAVWTPDAIEGLTITPAVSYQQSRIDSCSASESPNCIGGHFHGYDQFGNYADLNGESFPSAPEWQASLDAEYDWKLRDDITASVGVNVNYISQTNTWLTDPTPPPGVVTDPLKVPGYTLVDLRAGISRDAWRFELWGHNVTNAYYWTAANHVIDTVVRYAGMPATYGFTLSYRYQ
jgi:outer membrane receptor protein involved in Fe transport